jgi:hypothetical protein
LVELIFDVEHNFEVRYRAVEFFECSFALGSVFFGKGVQGYLTRIDLVARKGIQKVIFEFISIHAAGFLLDTMTIEVHRLSYRREASIKFKGLLRDIGCLRLDRFYCCEGLKSYISSLHFLTVHSD